ncbi:MAG: hypothetical protein V3T86_06775 [Planctomycetota bacterium]
MMRRLLTLSFFVFVGFMLSCGGSSGSGAILWIADGKRGELGNLYRVNLATGQLTTIGPIGFAVTGMAMHPNGTLYAVESTFGGNLGDSHLLTINKNTGQGSIIGKLDDSGAPFVHQSCPDITFVGERLIGWTEDSDEPMEIDIATGEVTVIGGEISSSGSGMAADKDGTVYFIPQGDTLYMIDPDTGVGTEGPDITGLNLGGTINSLTFFRGVLYGIDALNERLEDDPSALVSVDTTTGALTLIGELPDDIDAIASNAK